MFVIKSTPLLFLIPNLLASDAFDFAISPSALEAGAPTFNYVIATVFYPWLLYVSIKFSICVYPI